MHHWKKDVWTFVWYYFGFGGDAFVLDVSPPCRLQTKIGQLKSLLVKVLFGSFCKQAELKLTVGQLSFKGSFSTWIELELSKTNRARAWMFGLDSSSSWVLAHWIVNDPTSNTLKLKSSNIICPFVLLWFAQSSSLATNTWSKMPHTA